LTDEGWSASISSNGSQIVFLKLAAYGQSGSEIWVMDQDGSNARKVCPAGPDFIYAAPVWSPDGHSIAYEKFQLTAFAALGSVETLDLTRNTTQATLTDPLLDFGLMWLADGRLLYARAEKPNGADSNLWQVTLDNGTGRATGVPVRLTEGDGNL